MSAFCSASETVFITLDRIKLMIWREKKDLFSKSLNIFFPHKERFIITSLIGTNVAQVAFSSVAAVFFVSKGMPPWLVIVLSTVVLLIFAEILPKVISLSIGTKLARPFALLLGVIYYLLFPIVKLLSTAMKKFSPDVSDGAPLEHARRILKQVLMSDEIELHPEKAEIAAGVLSIADQKMREVMTPRTDIVSAPLESSLDEIRDLIISSGHSKIIIYAENIENIRGYVHALDLLKEAETLEEIIRPAVFVSEFTPVIEGLEALKCKGTGMVMVVDEYGGLDGIATIEDVAEEMFGEIEDEYDRPRFQYRKLKNGYFLISGRAEIDYLNEEIHSKLKKVENVTTFGGWVITQLGRIPDENEILRIEDLQIEVLLADEKSVKMLKVNPYRGS